MATAQQSEDLENGAFSTVCGQNVIIKGNTAEWCNVQSGGRIFVNEPLQRNSEIVLRLTESGHADVGLLTKNPRSLSDLKNIINMQEFKVIQSARIHKQEQKIKVKRSPNGQSIITNQADQTHTFSVQDTQKVWITVNIIFGSLKVRIDSPNYQILPPCDENICINTNKTEANLKYPYPNAICFFKHPVQNGESICFNIEPQLTDGRLSRNFVVSFAISEVNPETFLLRKSHVFDMSSLPVSPLEQPSKKVKNEITFKLRSNGKAEIHCEKGIFTTDVNIMKKAYFLLQICRVKVTYKTKTMSEALEYEEQNNSVDDANLADSTYVNRKRQLDEIRREVTKLSLLSNDSNQQSENENEGTRIEKLERQISDIWDQLQSLQSTDLLSHQIEEIKSMLRELTKRDRIDQSKQLGLSDANLIDLIQSNYADLVQLMDPIPVSDRLLQQNHITFQEHENNRKQHQTDRCETNRNILDVVIKRNIEVAVFLRILKDSKHDGIYSKIAPQQNT